MKYTLYLFLLLLAGCIKDIPCNQKTLKPIKITLSNQESFSYVLINVSTGSYDYSTQQVFHGNQEGVKIYIDTLDLTEIARSVPRGGKIIVAYKFFSLDGSYETHLDTLVKQ